MKKIINNKNLIVCFLIAISLIFMLSSFLSIDKNLSIISLTTLFVTLVLDAFLDIKKKYLLLLFYATFFLFSMGQYYFANNTNWIYYANYKINTIKLTIFIQGIALFFTFLSFNIFSKFIKIKELKMDYKKEINSKILMLCLILLFLITIVSHLEIGYRVMKYGYLVIYNNSIPSIFPSIFNYVSTFFSLMVFISLSIFKEKKYIYTTLLLYFIYLCYTLLTGVRGEFGIGIFLLIMYLFVYRYIINNHSINIKKIIKLGICLIIIIPVGAIGLNLLNTMRNNENINGINAFNQFQSFFVNQGSSVNLISMAIENEKELKSQDTLYVMGPLLENIESKAAKILPEFKLNILNNKSTSFAVDVSKIELGEEGYNSGQGLGSQYLAELYMDYSFLGIIIFSILLGFIIYILSNFYKFGIIGSSISLLFIQSILYLPRGQAIQPLNAILSFNYWFIIIIIYAFIFIKKNLKGIDESC